MAQETAPEPDLATETTTADATNTSDSEKASERMTRRRRDSRVSPRDGEFEKTGLYVSVFGGASIHQSATAEFQHTSLGNNFAGDNVSQYREEVGTFEMMGIKMGYFPYRDVSEGGFHPNFGAELEFTYIPLTIDGDNSGVGLNVNQDLDAFMFMANLILRIENKWLTPYMGVGFGLAYLESSATVSDSTGTIGTANGLGAGSNLIGKDDQQGAFAFQAIGGLEYEIFHWLGLFTEYKFIHYEGFNFSHTTATAATADVKLDYDFLDQHTVSGGLRFKF